MRSRTFVAFVTLAVAQLAGCSSCMREEEKPVEDKPTFTAKEKAPSLSGKYRFQLHADASASD